MHKLVSLIASAILLVAVPSAAQKFGESGTAVVGVERVFGIAGSNVTTENSVDGQPDIEQSYTGITFGWRGAFQTAPFDVPRAAFDYFVADRISVGGALGYASVGIDEGGTDSYSAFLIAPRGGYAYMFGEVAGIWPRGGVTFHTEGEDPGNSESGFALTLEAMFVLAPAEHVAILLGPTFDIDLFGSLEPEQGSDVSRTYRTFALQVGLAGWF